MNRLAASVTSALAACGPVQNHTSYATGRKLGNLTLDVPLEAVPSVCCSIGSSFARARSENSTKGVPWSATVLGPGKTHPDQVSVMCEAFDYGATTSGKANAMSGTTGPLPPLPAPLPKCDSFTERKTCPERCFWSDADKCSEKTPIPCGENTMQGKDNGPLCIHVAFNNSDCDTLTGGNFFKVTLDQNSTVLTAPPKRFTTDVWWSVGDGLYRKPTPHLEPFKYCVEYTVSVAGEKDGEAFAVCASLDGSFDLQVETTPGLIYEGSWHNVPFVGSVIISRNRTLTRKSHL
eukprot:g194.t1